MKSIKFKNILATTLISSIMIGCGGGTVTTQKSDDKQKKELVSQDVNKELSYDKEGKITDIKTIGDANGVAYAQDTIFVSEGKNGVEIIKIGYNDTISSEIIYTIKGINAKSVILSKDEKTLYIENETGFVEIYNISDLTHPIKKGQTTKQKINNAAISANNTYKYIPKGKEGLEVVNISNPKALTESTFNKSNAYDIVLIEDDTKALIATGAVGINLLDISNPKQINNIANYRIRGSSVTGLSLNSDKDILFVATGDKGVMVFDLDILLHKLGQ